MLPENYQWISLEFEPGEGDPLLLLGIARQLEAEGNLAGAATVYDRAYGIDPLSREIAHRRQDVLDQLAVVEHGICFRYVPGGVFLMGCSEGEPDERPVHPVWLSPYWMAETPVSWAAYCRLMDWELPPASHPRDEPATSGFDRARFQLSQANKIRRQYCEDQTTQARDWHAHDPGLTEEQRRLFGTPTRLDPQTPWTYETKPIVAVGWEEAEELARRLPTTEVRYSLPTEAQWEKAARGGLIGARHAWGNEEPTDECCDFDRFHNFSIQPTKTFPPNGYGLFAMNGCVWEWTRDWYDRDWYSQSQDTDPEGPSQGEEKVLRGGSWADCAAVQTVTFRMSRPSSNWREGGERGWGGARAPNIGFRLCRSVRG